MNPIRIKTQKGYIPVIINAVNIVMIKKQSLVASKYAPKDEVASSFLARIPSSMSVPQAKRKRIILSKYKFAKNKYRKMKAQTIRNDEIIDGIAKRFLLLSSSINNK